MEPKIIYQCPQPQKLYRSEKNRLIGGVAGGLAEYFKFEANFIRLLFIILTPLFGLGILVYFLLWLLLPTESKIHKSESENIQENVQDIAKKGRKVVQKTNQFFNTELKLWLAIVLIFFGLLLSIFTGFGFSNLFDLGPFLLLALIFLILLILIHS